MSNTSRHDAWAAGDRYEAYMGRWSRQIAPGFVGWLAAPTGLDWLDVGCGTGALSSAILARAAPRSLLSLDPSEDFVALNRTSNTDPLLCGDVPIGCDACVPAIPPGFAAFCTDGRCQPGWLPE